MTIDSRLELSDLNTILRNRGLESSGRVQQYVDKEVLRLSDPYIPFLTGQLKNSGTLHTVIGSGLVMYRTPYAARHYYMNSGHGVEGTAYGGLRGSYWFERMKADHKQDILRGAVAVAGGVI